MVLVDEGDPDPIFSELNAPYIKLYTAPTPNGQKVSILLELLKIKYHVRSISLSQKEQKEDWFIKLNPNGRIPVLSYANSKGKKFSIMESASIMLFLVDKFDKTNKFTFEYGSKNYNKMLQWIFFQMANIGPIQGQICHFKFYLPPDKMPNTKQYDQILEDYDKEIKNYYQILENQLIKNSSGYLVGDHLSVADLIHFPWIYECFCINIDLQSYPHLNNWLNSINKIPAVQRGMRVP
ncbi:glutathione S-transferase family protein [Ascoidea rubescens DSM 1968]|uniref:Nitrogen catabolite repression transcriptional regulator n=1 Tax=Ascoidea rubescens DSM 1968 TaxID=1344418 RepID=A0A1D2VHV2_9ASCO|nr:nitrogen catabolite repression transcriptional regulator [Ascoidea rubescens DSM 1968]ODV61199.1 nitrogen catabolite repression transcriptional regulator [Ascoidea rubescens DSM 1968]